MSSVLGIALNRVTIKEGIEKKKKRNLLLCFDSHTILEIQF